MLQSGLYPIRHCVIRHALDEMQGFEHVFRELKRLGGVLLGRRTHSSIFLYFLVYRTNLAEHLQVSIEEDIGVHKYNIMFTHVKL